MNRTRNECVMREFTYTNLRPPAARPHPTAREPVTTTNKIRLWWDGRSVAYDRRYVSSDGSVSAPIDDVFDDNLSAERIAELIHWGCCGWSVRSWQIPELVQKVQEFMG